MLAVGMELLWDGIYFDGIFSDVRCWNFFEMELFSDGIFACSCLDVVFRSFLWRKKSQ